MKRKSSKLPSIQFYPGDWRKDPGVQALNFFDRGVWFELLLLMFESEPRGYLTLNGHPIPDPALARLLGLSVARLRKSIETLLAFGVASRDEQGRLYSRRMVRDESFKEQRRQWGDLGAEHGIKGKEHGEKGGRPPVKKPPSKTPSKPPLKPPLKPPPSSSPSGKREGKSSLRSDSPSPDSASGRGDSGTGKTGPKTPRGRSPDPMHDTFAAKFQAHYGVPYQARKGDFVQLAARRKTLGIGARASPDDWSTACEHYLASPREEHTLAELAVKYATFRKHAVDRFTKPVETSNLPPPSPTDPDRTRYLKALEDFLAGRSTRDPRIQV